MSAKGNSKLIGKRFGELIVISDTGKRIAGQIIFNMACDCGNKVEMRRDYFDRKERGTKRCNECTKKRKTQGYGGISGSWWGQHFLKRQLGRNPSSWVSEGSVKNRYRKKIYETNLTVKDAWELYEKQQGLCNLSGLPINFPSNGKEFGGTASLDRIDSTKGYIKGNVQWVHKDINMMKSNRNQDYFISLCKAVAMNKG